MSQQAVRRQQHRSLRLSLRDEQSVERVTVQRPQVFHGSGVFAGHVELVQTQLHECPPCPEPDVGPEVEPAESLLDGVPRRWPRT